MGTPYPIRPVTEDELSTISHVHEHAFHAGPASERAHANFAARFEPERSLASCDGSTVAGFAASFSYQMRVPGALVPVAGVSMVGVLPTYRRRGILSSLMRRQLADLSGNGEAVAALWASEAGIYGRFGYGCASQRYSFTLRAGEAGFVPDAPVDSRLRLRLVDPQLALADLSKVYELALAERPGFFARNDAWWDYALDDPESQREGGTPLRCVVAEDDAGPRGYAVFNARQRWDDADVPDGRLMLREMIAADPAATAMLWRDLLTRDLISEFQMPIRPVDDPLLSLLADPRRARAKLSDGLWVRLLDVAAALEQRRYAAPVDVTIEVSDDLCPQNQGTWRLVTSPGSGPGLAATCQRASGAADISLPVRALGSLYLGGMRLGSLAAAGIVTESRPGAVAALSAAMSWDPAPWCPMIF